MKKKASKLGFQLVPVYSPGRDSKWRPRFEDAMFAFNRLQGFD